LNELYDYIVVRAIYLGWKGRKGEGGEEREGVLTDKQKRSIKIKRLAEIYALEVLTS